MILTCTCPRVNHCSDSDTHIDSNSKTQMDPLPLCHCVVHDISFTAAQINSNRNAWGRFNTYVQKKNDISIRKYKHKYFEQCLLFSKLRNISAT